jgi:hypothetical protein
LKKEQIKVVYADLYAGNAGKAELERLSAEDPQKAFELAEYLASKPLYMELSPKELIAVSLVVAGCEELPGKWIKLESPLESALEFFSQGEWDRKFEEVDPDKQRIIMSMVMAIAANLQSVQVFSKSIFELLAEFNSGDDEALFKAVFVDRSIVCAPTVQLRIQLAELMADEDFFDKLAKAIKKTRPARPSPEMDDMRAMLYILDDVGELAKLTNSELTLLFVDELQIYDDEGKADPSSAIAKFVQRFKRARTQKS